MHREITGAERDALIVSILDKIENDQQRIASPERVTAWRKGWQEALDRFKAKPSEEALIPAFIRSGQPLRVNRKFVMPSEPDAELLYCRLLQRGFLAPLFKDCSFIYEFGCGTGFNLTALAGVYPEKVFFGYDFCEQAVQLTSLAGKFIGKEIVAARFDMATLEPLKYTLGPGAGVFTFGSIEQLGGHNFKNFIDYLIEQKPKVVAHIEPIVELMDPANLVDALGIRFHKRRGYTEGLLPYLQAHPRVKVELVERSGFGSLMFESYGRIVWRPR